MEGEKLLADGVDLGGEFSRGTDDDGADVVFWDGLLEFEQTLDDGDEEGEGFAAARDGL